jgi:dTDP-4-amino-4,6-dideoxygalactose transaminase
VSDVPRIFLSPPHLGTREQELVTEAFTSNYVAPLGPMVDAFERELAAHIGIPHCLAVNSGTAAMHLALRCLGIGPGDVVLASTLTFIGSVTPITFLGATPVFVDADPATWNMDPVRLQEAVADCLRRGITPKAVIPTDLYGQCADYDRLAAICDPHGIPLVVDAAEAMGARYKDRHAGAAGRAAVFSFNGNKIITTSGGGLLASRDEALIARARKLSQQAREPLPHYEHLEIGYNYRLSNILAAIGRGQLQVLSDRVAARRALFGRYLQALGDLPGLSFMPEAAYGCANRWLTVLLLDPTAGAPTSESVRLTLEADDIEARPVWKPMHRQPVFRHCACVGGDQADRIFERGLCLPSGSALTEPQLARITGVIRRCFRA